MSRPGRFESDSVEERIQTLEPSQKREKLKEDFVYLGRPEKMADLRELLRPSEDGRESNARMLLEEVGDWRELEWASRSLSTTENLYMREFLYRIIEAVIYEERFVPKGVLKMLLKAVRVDLQREKEPGYWLATGLRALASCIIFTNEDAPPDGYPQLSISQRDWFFDTIRHSMRNDFILGGKRQQEKLIAALHVVGKYMCQAQESNVTIRWYSERGLVNAWVTALSAAPAPADLLMQFFRRATHVASGSTLQLDEDPVRAEIYVEPSLSQFGDPDLVVILHYRDGASDAVFLEAKLTHFLASSPPMSENPDKGKKPMTFYQKNGSTVLHELFLKAVLYHALKGTTESVEPGFSAEVYQADRRKSKSAEGSNNDTFKRTIGCDPKVVCLAQDLAKTRRAFFIALTTDTLPKNDRVAISEQIQEMCKINGREDWLSSAYVLSWHDLWQVAGKNEMPSFLRAIDENSQKFTFPVRLPDDKARLGDFWKKHGLKHRGTRQSPTRKTLYPEGAASAFATYSVVDALRGAEIHLYLIGKSRDRGYTCPLVIPWKAVVDGNKYSELEEEIRYHKSLVRSP